MLLLEQFEHLTLHPKNAAKLKELVLQLAVQGKLTENWRRQHPAVEPAAELLKRIEGEKAQLVREGKIKVEKSLPSITPDELPFQLPFKWTWCRLNDISEYIQRGKSPSYVDESHIPVVSQKCVQWDGFYLDRAKFIEPTTLSKYGKERFLVPNDILWNSTGDGTVGRATLYPGTEEYEAVVADSHVTVVRLMEKEKLPYFIKCFIATPYVQEKLSEQVTGSTKQTELSTGTVKSYLVPLPPLAEQEAIVARVEELMHKIEELEKRTAERIQLKKNLAAATLHGLTSAAAEELPHHWLFLQQHFPTLFDEVENVKKLRETILQLAVQGKLTATWRTQHPTPEPASELLKQIQAEKAQLVKAGKIKKEKPLAPVSEEEVPYELPEGWVWCRLGELGFCQTGTTPPTSDPRNAGNFIPFIGPGDITALGIDYSGVGLSEEGFLKGRLIPKDSILMVCIGGSIGKLSLNEQVVSCNQQINTITPFIVPSKSVMYSLSSPYFQKAVLEKATGSATPIINKGKWESIVFPLPPIAEQQAIVAKVDQLMQLCDELERQILQSRQEAEALMQAVVQEALQEKELEPEL